MFRDEQSKNEFTRVSIAFIVGHTVQTLKL